MKKNCNWSDDGTDGAEDQAAVLEMRLNIFLVKKGLAKAKDYLAEATVHEERLIIFKE